MTETRTPRVGDTVVFHQNATHPGGSRAVPALVHEASDGLVTMTVFGADGRVCIETRVPHRETDRPTASAFWRWPDEEPTA
jgi:hypothetical protein